MRNRHWGIPRYFSSVLLLIAILGLAIHRALTGAEWTEGAANVLAALFAWRTAWHYYMYPVTLHGGIPGDNAALARRKRRYHAAVALWIIVAVAATALIWHRLLAPES